MKFTGRVDVSPVATYYGQLAAMLRQDLPKTVRFEAAATVKRAMQFVKSSRVSAVQAAAIKDGVKKFSVDARLGGSTNIGKKGKVFGKQWMVRYDLGKALPMSIWSGRLAPMQDHTGQSWRVRNEDWYKFKAAWDQDIAETKAMIRQRIGARGITAKSWVDILEKIQAGGQVAGVAEFVRRARPIAGKLREVGFAMNNGEGTANYTLTITNESGLAVVTGGARKLAAAIAIRRKFFMNNMENGFFFDAKFVARNYPWVKVA